MFSSTNSQTVDNLIKNNNVVVFSKSYCSYCTRVKRALKARGIKATVIELDTRADGGTLHAAVKARTGRRTVPQVFVNGEHVGGSDDTIAALQSGKFDALAATAPSSSSRDESKQESRGSGSATTGHVKIADKVKQLIASGSVVMFGKTTCFYCKRAQAAFDTAGIQPVVVELDNRSDGRSIQSALQRMTGQRTVPNVFLNGRHIGGSDDVIRELGKGTFKNDGAATESRMVVTGA